MTCKIRFVCVSDTHNASPANGAFKLPKGDVLIHAGDLTNQGTYAEIRKTLDWIQAADFGAKIVIAGIYCWTWRWLRTPTAVGNHDVTLDRRFYAEHGLKFHNKHPQNSQACIDLFNEYPSIKYLNHESVEICLSQDKAPRVQFKVFGSPYSPVNGLWAFGYTPEEASGLWDQIPFDVDIVVTHTPPRYHCDGSRLHRAVGCEALHKKLRQVRPQLVVCGHIHEGRGAERVLWDYPSLSANNGESSVRYWIDPGHDNKKQSLLDLFAKGGLPLENNQSPETANAEVKFGNQPKTTNSTSPKSWSYAGEYCLFLGQELSNF